MSATSQTPELIRMANQIAANFAHHRVDQGAAEVAEHIKLFWTPSMRDELSLWIDDGGEELHPLVLEAFRLLRPSQ